MRLDRLQLDLRPRSHSQALDLGVALLRQSYFTCYTTWLTLWLPLILLCGLLAWQYRDWAFFFLAIPLWLRPLLERVIVLVLSRAVFGQQLSWWQALRAWPKELGGGWFRVLTWWRPFMPGRGLYQPIWQLEQARGRFAADRRRVLGRDGAGTAAFWFGFACFHFEAVLQIGLISLIGLFTASPDAMNPLWMLFDQEIGRSQPVFMLLLASLAIGAGIMAPIYTACCFTLYLNRRAELEAWDIEIILRRLAQERQGSKSLKLPTVGHTLAVLLAVMLILPQAVQAAPQCEPPESNQVEADLIARQRTPAQSAEQKAVRAELDKVYAHDDLRGYRCVQTWTAKNKTPKEPEKEDKDDEDKNKRQDKVPDWVADLTKALLILGAIALVAWLLYRYRDRIAGAFQQAETRKLPGEVAGMDIRPESLPDDIPTAVRKLWAEGQQRNALGLLYRATLSRLVHQYALALTQGATEGDCVRLAQQAHQQGELPADTLALTQDITRIWLAAAYAQQWPSDAALDSSCSRWQQVFGGAA
ncbi:hypothetical protein [Chitinimonas sp. JJ19]|uniref:hypothetical protein n=1 Tax=Chitinimonas sp. JJ19 TaxID=3109352 RepID=UPI00300135D6